jgi:PAS domain-containing protein
MSGGDGRLTYANHAWRQMMGYSEAEWNVALADIVGPTVTGCLPLFERLTRGEDVGPRLPHQAQPPCDGGR